MADANSTPTLSRIKVVHYHAPELPMMAVASTLEHTLNKIADDNPRYEVISVIGSANALPLFGYVVLRLKDGERDE